MPSLYCTRAKYYPGLDVTVHRADRRFESARLTVTSTCSLALAKLSSVLNIYVISYM